MKNYFMKSGVSQMISFDPETQAIDAVDYINSHVDWMYSIPEDGVITMNDIQKNVKKGDIVIKFYKTREFETNPFVVIRNKEWKENISTEKKYYEEMQAKRDAECTDSCCETCEKCTNC